MDIEGETSAKDVLFRAMVWAVSLLLTIAGVTVGYFYRSSQEAIALQFQELHTETTKQWDRINLIERRQDSIEWISKQNQIDLAAMKGKP